MHFAQFLSFPFLFDRITFIFFLCVEIFIKISAFKEKKGKEMCEYIEINVYFENSLQ